MDGDPDMIHQVVYNLFENAVKFTDPGGYIAIKIEDLPDRTAVTIRNSGHGIDPDDIRMIFDRFFKTDKSRSQDKNGLGLGLYIVKTIVHLHGGEITASSIVDQYTQFSFWLPKRPENVKNKENTLQKPEKDSSRKSRKSRKKAASASSPQQPPQQPSEPDAGFAPEEPMPSPETEASSTERNDAP